MIDHLSEDQLIRCVLDGSAEAELQHLRTCGDCRRELESFREAVMLFRRDVRDRVEAQAVVSSPIFASPALVRTNPVAKLCWTLTAAAILVVALIPLFHRQKDSPRPSSGDISTEGDPDALMRAVQFHLSRTVPEPMEPLLVLLPNSVSKTHSGGVQ